MFLEILLSSGSAAIASIITYLAVKLHGQKRENMLTQHIDQQVVRIEFLKEDIISLKNRLSNNKPKRPYKKRKPTYNKKNQNKSKNS